MEHASEKSGKGEKSKKSQSLSFLALVLSRFNPKRMAPGSERSELIQRTTDNPQRTQATIVSTKITQQNRNAGF